MKIIFPLALAVLCGAGCMSTGGLSKVVTALAKDPATATLRVTTPYGINLTLTRTNPGTNTSPHTIAPDGAVTIGKP